MDHGLAPVDHEGFNGEERGAYKQKEKQRSETAEGHAQG
jgi:hypothetical protein